MTQLLKIHPARTALRAALVLALLHLGCTTAFSQGLELENVITPKGTDTGILSPLDFHYDSFRGLFIVANTEAHRIDILTRQGDLYKAVGREGNLRFPRAVAAGSDANLFIALKDSEILKVLPLYDSGIGEELQEMDLSRHRRRTTVQPVALEVDRNGNLYVADRGNRQILVFDREQKFRFAIPDVGEPSAVAVGAGLIFVADPGFGGVRVYGEHGAWLRTLGNDAGRFPTPLRVKSLAVDRRERIWVLEEADQGIKVLDVFGNLLLDFPFIPGGRLGIFAAVDLALGPDRLLYLLEQGSGWIRVLRFREF